jgi:zinc protease
METIRPARVFSLMAVHPFQGLSVPVSSLTARRVARTFIFAAVALGAVAPLAAGQDLNARLPVDSKVKIGTLPNGLKYYIRQNAKPEKRAELRLVINAGSILEDADQLGLAHFVEHTAFNGTKNFKKNDLVNYLESIGVRFGADLNASTSFDETLYILPIPTDTARIVDKAFQILEDWAHGQLLDSAEVVAERGVVLEEWRGRKGSGERMLQQWMPIAFKGSLYAERLPIGTQASIESATPARLRRFYNDWYRPDLMAVVAVGDFDVGRIETLIKQHFSGLVKPANARPRPVPGIPDNAAPLVAIATDKEATSTDVNVIFKLPPEKQETVRDYRRGLLESLYMTMLNGRFEEITSKPNAPFLGAGASKGDFFARNRPAFFLGAGVNDGEVEKGLQALLVEARRVDQFGFLQTELDRARSDLLRGYERMYAERDKTQSASFVSEYVGNFLSGEPIPGLEYEYDLTKKLLPTVTLAEVNTLAKSWITENNRVILVQTPDKPGLTKPTEQSLLAVFGRAAAVPVTAYTEALSGDALLSPLPAPGRIVSESRNASINLTEWKLSNGARVLVKPTDFKDDEVVFSSYSLGGTSLAPNADYMSAAQATTIVGLSGIGKFNQVDLGKKLSGITARVTPGMSDTQEATSGGGSPKDIETLLQLNYLYFTAPHLDTDAFAAFKQQVAPYLANRGADPNEVFSDSVTVTLAQHHFRARPISAATFAEVDPNKALAFYKERFANAGDFTFVFVGNVKLDVLRPLVERYLASLPATAQKESFKDSGVRPPTGVVEKVIRKGTEPKAQTEWYFTGPFTYTPENRVVFRAMIDLFQLKLTETLREQLGGAYSPSAGGAPNRIPIQDYTINISYSSSPANVDKLSASVLALIDSMKRVAPTAADLDKVKEGILRSREIDLKQNSYWLTSIRQRDQAGEDIAGIMEPYNDLVRGLTPQKIQDAARQYFNTGNYVKLVLLPER